MKSKVAPHDAAVAALIIRPQECPVAELPEESLWRIR